MARTQRIQLGSGERTWTVLDNAGSVVEPAEAMLEFMRAIERSPNTVKSYARGLELWWTFLEESGRPWDEVSIGDLGDFLVWLRTGIGPGVSVIGESESRFSESTINQRLQAVYACYRFHHLNGVDAASRFYVSAIGSGGQYKPFLEHVARRRGSRRQVVRVRRPARAEPPVLTPAQTSLIKDACASFDEGRWTGVLRDRLLFAVMEETGMRLGEALSLQHRDWAIGRGDAPHVAVVPRDGHPHGLRVKGGRYRRIFLSDELDALYAEYVWDLYERGIDADIDDLDDHWIFVNLSREPLWGPMRPETVYKLTRRLKRQLGTRVPAGWTPHWLRHTHATALLLAGAPLVAVSRRLGHADTQTTLNQYAWVTEDDELQALADWQGFVDKWRVDVAG